MSSGSQPSGEAAVRFMSHVTTLPPPAAALVRWIVQWVSMRRLMTAQITAGESGTAVTRSCVLAERVAVMLDEGHEQQRPLLMSAALLHGIAWAVPEVWARMPSPVNKWRAARYMLLVGVLVSTLELDAYVFGLRVMECLEDAGTDAESPEAKLLLAAEHALLP